MRVGVHGRAAIIAMLGASSACVADPLPAICPDIGVGELVITEIRGQLADSVATSEGSDGVAAGSTDSSGDSTSAMGSDADRGRDWIEITNLTDRTLDLWGLAIRNTNSGGAGEVFMRVRYRRELDAHGVYVLGLSDDEMRPSFVDYGVGGDFSMNDSNLYDEGALTVQACGVDIDIVRYLFLPTLGSWSLGVMPPDAAANDDIEAWCEDPVLAVIDGREEPGTPGEANRPCD